MPSEIEIGYQSYCFPKNNYYGKYVLLFHGFIFLLPFILYLVVYPVYFAKKRLYGLIPTGLGLLAFLVQYIWEYERPYANCLTFLHTKNGMPCPEVVLVESAFFVLLVFIMSRGVELDKDVYIFLQAGFLITLVCIPVLTYVTFVASELQVLGSILFSLLSIPLFYAINKYYYY